MKNAIRILGIGAITAISLVSCVKEEVIVNEPSTHRVTIHVSDSETKTAISEGVSSASFVWSSDDASRFYLLENEAAATNIAIASGDGYSTITIDADFTNSPAAEYTYKGFLAKNKSDGCNPLIPTSQTSTGTSYDPDADILVARPQTFGARQDELSMQFARPVVINKMTLKGLTAGETVSSVTIGSDKDITGEYDWINREWAAGSRGREITVATSQVVPASGQVTVYFVSMPVDAATLTVVAETEEYTYSKTFASTINLLLGKVTVFGVSSLTREAKPGVPTLRYTLDGTETGGTSGYAEVSAITQSGIGWKVLGNTTVNPWRIGGKSITNENRAIYSTTPIPENISRVEVTSGTYTLDSVNSLTITVHNSASDAQTGDNPLASKVENVQANIVSKTVTLQKADETLWAGKYYRIVYNVTKTDNSNAYIQLLSVKLYGVPAPPAESTATVTTGGTSGLYSAGATLLGSFSGATGRIGEAGFEWAESAGDLDGNANYVYDDNCLGEVASGTISAPLTSLSELTTYYYRAFVAEYNESTGDYDYRYGEIRSFTTTEAAAESPAGWLELPALTGAEDQTGRFYGSGSSVGTNRNYSYNYSLTWYGCLWVAYPLAPAHTSGSASTSTWRFNPQFSSDYQVTVNDGSYTSRYNNSAYARGHQIPNASRKSDDTMNMQTYYVTNQTPQLQNKFNASIWGSLEGAVRTEVNSYNDTIYVVTGACYRKAGGNETINYLTAASASYHPASLPIPNYYWKALLKVCRSGESITSAITIGYWFDHREYEGNESYTEHVVSVDTIESFTGFDLFTNLPGTDASGLEQSAETNTSWTSFHNFAN